MSTKHLTKLTENKKALSHIEMIISFSLFIVFLMFLFIYVNPIRRPNVSEVLLDTVELGLDSYKIDFVEIPFKVSSPSGCFNINSPINLDDILTNSMYITNEQGDNIAFRREGPGENNLSIEASGTFYYIYSSDKSFKDPAMHLSELTYPTCSYTAPTFSVPRIKAIYHYQELLELNKTYYTDYEVLKQNFTFPANSDFAITITKAGATAEGDSLVMTRTKPQTASVTARDVPIEVLTEEGDIKNITRANMNIQVW